MVKGWILDLPIIPQPIVFLCIVLTAQPTLSWSLSDLDQWAHFSQYRGLCQQRLHILIVMHCKHQKSKKDILLQNQNMEALKLLNEHGDPDILLCIANIMSQRWKDILRQTEIYGGIQTIEWPQNQGGHARLTQPSPSGQFRWLAIAMMKNAKGPDRPFTMRLLYNAPCGRWPIDHGLCRSQTMLNKRQGKPDQDFIVPKNNQSPDSRISIFMFNICLKPHFTESQ